MPGITEREKMALVVSGIAIASVSHCFRIVRLPSFSISVYRYSRAINQSSEPRDSTTVSFGNGDRGAAVMRFISK